jgi:hypothetical protein
MPTIKLKQNGSVVLKDGKASCRYCPCRFVEDPFLERNYNYNTFTITKKEYDNYIKNNTLLFNININNSEGYDLYNEGLVYGSCNFSINSSIETGPSFEECCIKTYFIRIPFSGTLILGNEAEEPPYVNVYNFNSFLSMTLVISLQENQNSYEVNYTFDLFFGQPLAIGIERHYTSSYYFYPSPGQNIPPYKEITGHPINMSLNIDGNIMNAPKIYRGPRGDWFEYGDDYTDNSIIDISISRVE